MSCAPLQNKSFPILKKSNPNSTETHVTSSRSPKKPVKQFEPFPIAKNEKNAETTSTIERNDMFIELAASALSIHSRNRADHFKFAANVLARIELTELQQNMTVTCCLRVTRMLEQAADQAGALPEERAFALKHMLPFQIKLAKNASGQALKNRVYATMFASLGLRLEVAESLRDRLDCHYYRAYALQEQSELGLAEKMNHLVAEAERVASYRKSHPTQRDIQQIAMQIRCVATMAGKIAKQRKGFYVQLRRIKALLGNVQGCKAAA